MWGFFSRKKHKPSHLLWDRADLLAPITGSRLIYIVSVYKSYFVLLFQKFLWATFYNCLVGNELCFYTARTVIFTSRLHARWGTAAGTRLLCWVWLWGCSPSPAHTGAQGISDSGAGGVLALRTPPSCGHPRKPPLTPEGALPRPSPCPGCPCPSPAQRAQAYREPRREQQQQQQQRGQAEEEAAERLHGCTAGPHPPHGAASGAARPALPAAGGAGLGTARPGHARHPRADGPRRGPLRVRPGSRRSSGPGMARDSPWLRTAAGASLFV